MFINFCPCSLLAHYAFWALEMCVKECCKLRFVAGGLPLYKTCCYQLNKYKYKMNLSMLCVISRVIMNIRRVIYCFTGLKSIG